jgi:hypothetical protein
MMQVKNVTYTEFAGGAFLLGFRKMETHMAER